MAIIDQREDVFVSQRVHSHPEKQDTLVQLHNMSIDVIERRARGRDISQISASRRPMASRRFSSPVHRLGWFSEPPEAASTAVVRWRRTGNCAYSGSEKL